MLKVRPVRAVIVVAVLALELLELPYLACSSTLLSTT